VLAMAIFLVRLYGQCPAISRAALHDFFSGTGSALRLFCREKSAEQAKNSRVVKILKPLEKARVSNRDGGACLAHRTPIRSPKSCPKYLAKNPYKQ
jgi:hypothetical protein